MVLRRRAMCVWAVAAAASCKQTIVLPGADERPMSFEVSFRSGDPGAPEAPLPFATVMTFEVDIQTIGRDGASMDWNGDVHLAVNPVGTVVSENEWVPVTGGRAEAILVDVEGLHGESHIWVEDTGTADEPGSFATGLSPRLHVGRPTIANLQQTDNIRLNALEGDFVELEVGSRDVVVTAVTNDGFYASDKLDPAYGGIFVFSHSRPREVQAGDRLLALSGTAEEFFGFTELGFPSWKLGGKSTFPAPILLSPAVIADDTMMEQYESGLVEITGATVCPLTDAFTTFGQWSALVDPAGSCASGQGAVTIISSFTVDWFDPAQEVGTELASVVGNLRYHLSAEPPWILRPRANGDLVVAAP